MSGFAGMTIDDLNRVISAKLKLQFAFVIIFWTALWTAKISLMMFYRKLFMSVNGYLLYWRITLGLLLVSYAGCMISNIVVCLPISKRFSLLSCKRFPPRFVF